MQVNLITILIRKYQLSISWRFIAHLSIQTFLANYLSLQNWKTCVSLNQDDGNKERNFQPLFVRNQGKQNPPSAEHTSPSLPNHVLTFFVFIFPNSSEHHNDSKQWSYIMEQPPTCTNNLFLTKANFRCPVCILYIVPISLWGREKEKKKGGGGLGWVRWEEGKFWAILTHGLKMVLWTSCTNAK